ncbi:MAG: aldo/keto reductase [Gammaproteobacteria bacterium]|nr:aldo/keto reductase [Gammaproteobacteria bacterium]
MKLGLGTVQFGLDYGVSNAGGRVPEAEVEKILATAGRAEISVLDTANLYGDSEAVLGRTIPPDQHFRVVTKTLQFRTARLTDHDAHALRVGFEQSLTRLGAEQVYGLLVHHADDLLVDGGEALHAEMLRLRASGQVAKIGVSVYDTRQLDDVLERYPVDLVQLPLNVCDRRFISGGHLAALQRAGVEVHARSAFLQGLLLMDDAKIHRYFDPYRDRLRAYFRALADAGLSRLQGALAFVASVPEVDIALVGVTSQVELVQIVDALAQPLPDYTFFDEFTIADEGLINPSRWQIA